MHCLQPGCAATWLRQANAAVRSRDEPAAPRGNAAAETVFECVPPAAETSPSRSCVTAATESALRPIRRLEEPAVVHATRMEEATQMECHNRKGPEHQQKLCLSHEIHLLSSPRT